MKFKDIAAQAPEYGNNFGSIRYFLLAIKTWLAFDVYVDPVAGCINEIPPLVPGKSWIRVDCQIDTMGYEETVSKSAGGDLYKAELTGIVLKDDLTKHINMRALAQYEYVAIYYDYNKAARVIGNKEKGLSFFPNYKTSNAVKDATRYGLSLQTELKESAPFLSTTTTGSTYQKDLGSRGLTGGTENLSYS